MKKIFFRIFLWIIIFCLFTGLFVFAVNFYVLNFSNEKNILSNVDKLEHIEIWLVFWASIKNNFPSVVLKDRLDVALEAYKKWKISKIIVSWDNSKKNYNEPVVMKEYLALNWVKREDIYEDFAWFDTYDSIYRARDIFKAKKIVFFTQEFHLKRALYIAEKLGIEAVWVSTDLRKYANSNYNFFREIFARVKAFLDADIFKVKPKFLWEPIKIVSNNEITETKEVLKWEELEDFLKTFSWNLDK